MTSADPIKVSRLLLILSVLSVIATACGGGSTVATQPVEPRGLSAPPGIADDGAERIATPEPDVDEACAAIERGITGESGRALYAAGADGGAGQVDALNAVLEPLGPDAVAHVPGLTGLDGTDAGVLAYKTALDGLDRLSVERCDVPAGTALFVLHQAAVGASFQCVSAAIDDETCEESFPAFPARLPCFEALGGSWLDGGGPPWQPIDCASGEPVTWSHRDAAWTTSTAADAFGVVGESIGE